MARGRPATNRGPITEEDILRHINVPTEIAAQYIGWSNQAVRAALREGSVPFGAASQPSGRSWSYNIVAPALVRYRSGELPAYNHKELQNIALEGVSGLIDEKLEQLKCLFSAVVTA